MDAKTIWSLLQILAGVVVLVAGGFSWYYGEKESKEKDSKYGAQMGELLERAKNAEESFKGLNAQTKEIREVLAQRYPGIGFEEAIERLRRDLDQQLKTTRDLATRNEFRRLKPEIRAEIVARLKQIAARANARSVAIRLYVTAHSHDDQRSRALEQIKDVMIEGGLQAQITGEQIHVGGNVGNPVAIGFHSRNQDIATDLADILQPLVGMPFPGTKDDARFTDSTIEIKVSGRPEFGPDGTVIFK